MPSTNIKILDSASRARLDDIVLQMDSNGENPETIQNVVNDFKEKYGKTEEQKTNKGQGLIKKGFSAIRTGMAAPIAAARTVDAYMGLGQGAKDFSTNLENVKAGRAPSGESSLGSNILYGALTDPASLVVGPMGAAYKGAGIGRSALQGLKEGAISAGIHQTEKAGEGGSSLGGFIGESAMSSLLPAGFSTVGKVAGVAKRAAGSMADMFTKVAKIGDDLKSTSGPITTKSGFKLTPGQVNPSRLSQSIEFEAQTNPFLSDIPGEIAEQNRQVFGRQMGKNVSAIPRSMGLENVPSAVGANIEDVMRQSKEGINETFRNRSEMALSPLENKKLYTQPLKGFKGVVPVVKAEVDGILNKYTQGPAGSSRISLNATGLLQETSDNLTKYRKPLDLLNLKRRFGNTVYSGSKGDVPLFDGADQAAFNEVYGSIDNAIGETFNKLGENAKPMRQLWEATNKRYSTARGALEGISQKLGVESKKVNPESYMQKINSLGAEKLSELKTLAKQDPDLSPVYDEIQGAFFDNFLNRIKTKGKDDISMDKLISEWSGMDQGVKEAIMPSKVIKSMDEIVDVVKRQKSTNMWDLNPSGTAIRLSGTSALKNPKEWLMASLMRGPIKDYYETGHIESFKTLYGLSKGLEKPRQIADQIAKNKLFKAIKERGQIITPLMYRAAQQGVRSELSE